MQEPDVANGLGMCRGQGRQSKKGNKKNAVDTKSKEKTESVGKKTETIKSKEVAIKKKAETRKTQKIVESQPKPSPQQKLKSELKSTSNIEL